MDDFLWAIEIVTAVVDDGGVGAGVVMEAVVGVKDEGGVGGGVGSGRRMLRNQRGRGRLLSRRVDGRKNHSGWT